MNIMLTVALILFVIWGSFYYLNKKSINSGKVYFFMLFCMMLPPTFDKDVYMGSWFHEVDYENIIVFSLCLIVGFIPWLVFDKESKNKVFHLKASSIQPIKLAFAILIIWSLYSILYLAPIAIRSVALGAQATRALLYSGHAEFVPSTFSTTIAVAGAGCYIYAILFFYISTLSPELKRYRIWLVISSFSYIVNCLAFTARDGLVFVPLFYLVFYLVFKNSLNVRLTSIIKKRIKLVVLITFIFLATFSLSRFAGNNDKTDWNGVYIGTVGYITQQPYVFDETIKEQDDFWGLEVRFPLINRLVGIKEYSVNRRDNSFEWSFGTMYSEHYSAFGWPSLIIITLITTLFFGLGIAYLFKSRRYFGAIMLFNVYCFIVISGMFYTRAGSNINMNIFYITLSVLPFLLPRYISCSPTR